jgi:hypothetical protein
MKSRDVEIYTIVYGIIAGVIGARRSRNEKK